MVFSFGTSTAQPAASTSFGVSGQNTQPQSTGLFGSTTGTQPTGTSLFGTKQPAATGTSLFGQPAGQQAQPPTTSLFGSTPQQPAQQTQTSSLFGNTQPSNQQQTSLFGSTNQQNQTQTQPTSGLFGGASTTQNQAPSLFGTQSQAQPQQQQPIGLSSSTLGILGPSALQNRRHLLADVPSSFPKKRTLQERLQKVASGVIDQSQTELRSYVYHSLMAPNGQEHQWPGDKYISRELFEEAQRHNPSRSGLLPIEIKGYEAMKQRVDIQVKHETEQRSYFDALQGQLTGAYQEITQTLTLSQDSLSNQSSRVFSLLIGYVSAFASLVRTVKGSDLTKQEEDTYKLLKDVIKAYDIAGNGGRMEGRLAEFWACILRLKQIVDHGYAANGRFDWTFANEQELLKIFKEQGKALTVLRNVAQDQKFDVETLEKGLPLSMQ